MADDGGEFSSDILTTPGGDTLTAPIDPNARPKALTSEQIFQGLRELAQRSSRPRQAAVLQGITGATEAANASPQRTLEALRGQVGQLRDQLQARFATASQALGPSGGRQIGGLQGSALASSGDALQQLLTQGTVPGFDALLQLFQQIRPALVTQLPQPVTQETQGPPDFSGLAFALQQGANLYNTLRSPAVSTYTPAYAQQSPLAGPNNTYTSLPYGYSGT